MQIQALIAGGVTVGAGGVTEESNTGSNIEVTKPPVFNGDAKKVEGFITAYRLYDEIERDNGGGTNSMSTVIYVGRICGCVEKEFIRRFGNRRGRIWIS